MPSNKDTSEPVNLRTQDNCYNCGHSGHKTVCAETMIACEKHEMLANPSYALNHICDNHKKEKSS